MKKFMCVFVLFLSINLIGCVSTKPQTSSKKARVVIDVPVSVDAERVKNALKEAVAYRSDGFQEIEGFPPDIIPTEPGSPQTKPVFGGGLAALAGGNPQFEALNTNTSDAYYTIRGQEMFGSFYNKKQMSYVGSIYSAKEVNRVYLYVFYQEGSSGITGALTKAVVDQMAGAKGAIPFVVQIKERFLASVPEAAIVSTVPSELKDLKLTSINRVENAQ
jgi:hypothetical protein